MNVITVAASWFLSSSDGFAIMGGRKICKPNKSLNNHNEKNRHGSTRVILSFTNPDATICSRPSFFFEELI